MNNCVAWLRQLQQTRTFNVLMPPGGKRMTKGSQPRRNCQKRSGNGKGQSSDKGSGDDKQTPQDAAAAASKSRQRSSKLVKMPKRLSVWRYATAIVFGGLCATVLWAVYELGKPEEDQRGHSIEDELSLLPLLQQYLQRMWRSLNYYQKMLEEPRPTKLLPDPLKYPYTQPPYTLVLEMQDVLVHPDWTYQTGWRFKKRPGVDHFLRQCSKHFEIVIYTNEQGMTAFPIIDALDPNGYVSYRLVRGSTQLLDGKHIKNLDRLNRDIRRIIVIDWDASALPLHQDNVFAIARWVGNDDDVQLFDLAAFLSLIAVHKMDDVREVLHYYRQFGDPIEQFKENQRKMLELRQEQPDTGRDFDK